MTFKQGAFGFIAFGAIATLSIPMTSAPALAEKQLTYEQAWAKCKKLLDDQRTPGTMTNNDRWFRGSACMKHYGHNI